MSWKEDPEGMEARIVAAMKELGYAKGSEGDDTILQRWYDDNFEDSKAWMEVSDLAEEEDLNSQIMAAEAQAEGDR